MKKPPQNPEFAKFTEAMRKIMTVQKSAIQTEKRKPKTSAVRVPADAPKRAT